MKGCEVANVSDDLSESSDEVSEGAAELAALLRPSDRYLMRCYELPELVLRSLSLSCVKPPVTNARIRPTDSCPLPRRNGTARVSSPTRRQLTSFASLSAHRERLPTSHLTVAKNRQYVGADGAFWHVTCHCMACSDATFRQKNNSSSVSSFIASKGRSHDVARLHEKLQRARSLVSPRVCRRRSPRPERAGVRFSRRERHASGRRESEREDIERKENRRREIERSEIEKRESERKEIERSEIERREGHASGRWESERKERYRNGRRESKRRESDRTERHWSGRKESERRERHASEGESERCERKRQENERKQNQRIENERKEKEKKENERRKDKVEVRIRDYHAGSEFPCFPGSGRWTDGRVSEAETRQQRKFFIAASFDRAMSCPSHRETDHAAFNFERSRLGASSQQHDYVNMRVPANACSAQQRPGGSGSPVPPTPSPAYANWSSGQSPCEQLNPRLNYADLDFSACGNSDPAKRRKPLIKSSDGGGSGGGGVQANSNYAKIDMVATVAASRVGREHAQLREENLRRKESLRRRHEANARKNRKGNSGSNSSSRKNSKSEK